MNKYMTTRKFIESVEALGFKTEHRNGYSMKYIDVYEDRDIIAFVSTDKCCMLDVVRFASEHDHQLLFKILCAYASTPVGEREPKVYKLKILDTDLYLININKRETTVTTNKEAAKAYDSAGTYDAKVLAEKQGFALRAEAI